MIHPHIKTICITVLVAFSAVGCQQVIERKGREIPIPDCKPIVKYTETQFSVKGATINIPKVGDVVKIGEAVWERQLLQKASDITQILDNHRIKVCHGLLTAIGASDSVFDEYLLNYQREEQRLTQLSVLLAANQPDAVLEWIDAYGSFALNITPEKAGLKAFDELLKTTTTRLEVNELVSAMLANYNDQAYDFAEERADEILKLDPNNWRALNMKGSVAFYRENFLDAATYFTRASQLNPIRIIKMNLADTYIELGAIARALDLYRSVEDGRPDWSYAMGRALLYDGKFQESLKYLEGLPSHFKDGSPRVIEAAALAGLARNELDAVKRNELFRRAKNKLQAGETQKPDYWGGILSGNKKDIHEGFAVPLRLLEVINDHKIK